MAYKVVLEWDGCHVRDLTTEGGREDCQQWIANHLCPNGQKYEMGIVNTETGRQVSFLIPVPTVARRIRVS